MTSTMSSSVLSDHSLRRHDHDDVDKPPVPVRVRTMESDDGQEKNAENTDAEHPEKHHVRFASTPEVVPDVPHIGVPDGQRLDSGIDREELIKAIVEMQMRPAPSVDTTVVESTADESAADNVGPVDHGTGEDPYNTKLYPDESIDEDDSEDDSLSESELLSCVECFSLCFSTEVEESMNPIAFFIISSLTCRVMSRIQDGTTNRG